jgi:hypothetical protein
MESRVWLNKRKWQKGSVQGRRDFLEWQQCWTKANME